MFSDVKLLRPVMLALVKLFELALSDCTELGIEGIDVNLFPWMSRVFSAVLLSSFMNVNALL